MGLIRQIVLGIIIIIIKNIVVEEVEDEEVQSNIYEGKEDALCILY